MGPQRIAGRDASEPGAASLWRGASAQSAARTLLFQTLLVAVVGVGILASVLAYGLRFPIERAVREEAVRETVDTVSPRILKIFSPQDLAQPLTGARYEEVDRMVRDFALEPGTERLKLWNPSGTVVYSTLREEVGESYPDNDELRLALQGKPAWEVGHETESPLESDLGEVFEVYIPLAWQPGDKPAGVVEVYVPYAPYARHLASIRNAIFLAAGLASLIVAVAWYLLYRVGSRQINREHHRNELILSSAGDGIFGLDSNGHGTFVNPAAARMLGWGVNEFIGRSPDELIHHSKPDGTPYPLEECPIRSACRDGSAHRVSDEVFWRKDGGSFPVSYVVTPILEGRGRVAGAVVAFQDVTERREVERLKDEFVSTVSHELRTPLTSIRVFVAPWAC